MDGLNMNKRWRKFKRIFTIIILFILCFNVLSNSVFAEVNSSYSNNTGTLTASNLEDTLNDENSFLTMFTSLIYTVASAAEWLIQGVFSMTTGMKTFPWADKIIFNAVPFLDINFINPSTGSLFQSKNGQTAIAQIVQNIYYTVFTIGVAFLGVCVGIMALRLIFAAIADEKAKYKKSLMQVVMAMIMLFLSHYMISFIFMVNEKMVEVAYSICMNATEGMQITIADIETDTDRENDLWKNHNNVDGGLLGTQNTRIINGNNSDERYLKQFSAYNNNSDLGSSEKIAENLINDKNYKYALALITGKFENGNDTIEIPNWENYKNSELTGIYNDSTHTIHNDLLGSNKHYFRLFNLLSDINYLANIDESKDESKIKKELYEYCAYAEWKDMNDWLQNSGLGKNGKKDPRDNSPFTCPTNANNKKCNRIYYSKFFIEDAKSFSYSEDNYLNKMNTEELASFLFNTWKALNVKKDENGTQTKVDYADRIDSVINNKHALQSMGAIFKKNAYNPNNKDNKYNIVACILYAMFIVQSIMYFIAYIKRFFYVLMLALFAPLVIVFDFLTNVTK